MARLFRREANLARRYGLLENCAGWPSLTDGAAMVEMVGKIG